MMVDVILVNWLQQTFNDALYFYEKASSSDKNVQPSEYWRNCTWSIISSTFCMEGYLLSFISARLHELDDAVGNVFDNSNFGFDKKIEVIEQCLALNLLKHDSDWANIRNMVTLRNDMAHFSRSNIFNDLNLDNAQKAIKACRDLIRKLHLSNNTDYKTTAAWIDNLKSKKLDS